MNRKILGALTSTILFTGAAACSGGLNFVTGAVDNLGSATPESGSGSAEPEADKPVPMRPIAGSYSFQDGHVEITQDGDKAHGVYDRGTFDCKYEVARYKCTWQEGADTTGFAEIHWYGDELIGNWGFNPEKLDRPWDFRDPSYQWKTASSGASDSGSGSSSSSSEPTSVSVMIKNQCSSTVQYCVVSRGGSTSNPTLSGNASTSTSLDVGGAIKSRNGSSCGGTIANIDASTREVILCKK